jgi:hypothetical protein
MLGMGVRGIWAFTWAGRVGRRDGLGRELLLSVPVGLRKMMGRSGGVGAYGVWTFMWAG